MHAGRFVFAQLMDHLPPYEFQKCVARYEGNYKFRGFSCLDQFLCLAFAQLTFRESLRDIEACLRAVDSKLFHLGFRGKISRSTLADANEAHDWRMYADFAQVLIGIARPMYAHDSLGFDLDNAVYALDSTTIDLCLSVFPWARFRARKAAIKMHTLLDLRGPIPTFIEVSDGKLHDVNILDILVPEPASFYVMDRGYVDFERLHVFHRGGAFFVTRTKRGVLFRRRYSHPVEASTGVRSDHTVVWPRPPRASTTPIRSGAFTTTMPSRAAACDSLPTTSTSRPSPSAGSTNRAGRWNCSSSGSSSTCGSRLSSASARTR